MLQQQTQSRTIISADDSAGDGEYVIYAGEKLESMLMAQMCLRAMGGGLIPSCESLYFCDVVHYSIDNLFELVFKS